MKLIAHRGASGLFPENTRASFRAALEQGAPAVEFDVQRTRDGELVVLHDTDLKRLAGKRVKVRSLSWPELSDLDVGSWFDPRFFGERVPRLGEILDLCLERAEIHLEIKQARPPYPGIEEAVLAELRRRSGAFERVVVSSFHYPTLKRIRALDNAVRLGYLAGPLLAVRSIARARALGCESLHLSVSQASASRVRAALAAGLKVLVYTVNKPQDAARLAALGVDGVFTDHFDRLKADGGAP